MGNPIQEINQNTLLPLVREALDNPMAKIKTWHSEKIYGGWGGAIGGTALFRFYGTIDQNDNWSLVLKILFERPHETEESPYYWKREFEIYRAGMLDNLFDKINLSIPRIYGLEEFTDRCWIWMEEIQPEDEEWNLDTYFATAYRLGEFNGIYLNNLDQFNYPWLNNNWHCRIIPPLADAFENLDEYAKHPLVQRTLPLSEKENILSIWQDADKFCTGLMSLPQTLCHLDAFRRNLFHKGQRTVLIDWALAGTGHLGEELTSLVAVTLYMREIPMEKVEEFDSVIFSGYADGLRDAGWEGADESIRLGYTCAMVLRGLAGVKQDIHYLLDENRHEALKNDLQTNDLNEIADFYAEIRRFRLLKMAEEARKLINKLM